MRKGVDEEINNISNHLFEVMKARMIIQDSLGSDCFTPDANKRLLALDLISLATLSTYTVEEFLQYIQERKQACINDQVDDYVKKFIKHSLNIDIW